MPIIGRGDIASQLGPMDKPDITWFASGVSNSSCEDEAQFQRELRLLFEQDKQRHIVYFSSLCIYKPENRYADHKRQVESLLRHHFHSHTIVRLGNILWGDNPNTFINYLRNNPEAPVREVYRHVVDLKEFQYWMSLIRVGRNDIMNIPGRMVWVPDFVKEIRGNG